MKVITILMSTYNGERFLEKQLTSINRQSLSKKEYSIRLFVRDDGSSDRTIDILNSWKEKLSIDIVVGNNIGARESFFALLCDAPESDYYAFCDQDDIWDENKLERAIACVDADRTLYFSNVRYIDEYDKPLGENLLCQEFNFTLTRLLMCNPANGCSMVWNRGLQKLIKDVPYDTFTMHDEYLCTIATLFGNVVYDSLPTMGYRVHGSNVTQSNSLAKKIKLWKSIWFGRAPYSLDKRAKMLLGYHLANKDKLVLSSLCKYKRGINRFRLIRLYSCEDRGIERSFRLRMLIGVL